MYLRKKSREFIKKKIKFKKLKRKNKIFGEDDLEEDLLEIKTNEEKILNIEEEKSEHIQEKSKSFIIMKLKIGKLMFCNQRMKKIFFLLFYEKNIFFYF